MRNEANRILGANAGRNVNVSANMEVKSQMLSITWPIQRNQLITALTS